MTWTCLGCTTAYAPESPCCPHCGSTEYVETGEVIEADEQAADEVAEEKPSRRSKRAAQTDTD